MAGNSYNEKVEVKPSAALGDAEDLKNIVSNLQQSTERLGTIMKSVVNSELSLDWADTVLKNWMKFAETDMQTVFRDITNGSASLELAVEEAIKYNDEL